MIIILLAIVLLIISFIIVIYRDKLQLSETKIKMVEEKINSILIKRIALIKDSETIIKELLKTDKTIYENLYLVDQEKKSIIELDRNILISINDFNLIKNKYEALNNNEEFQKIVFNINETNELLKSYKDYYNSNIKLYNKLIKKFPHRLINFILHKKQKIFFEN